MTKLRTTLKSLSTLSARRPRAPKPRAPSVTEGDPLVAAHAAGLRYVRGDEPGIRRLRAGQRFRYVDSQGKGVRDPQDRGRIDALAIPPAWTDVWICTHANGHLQATGQDAKGRKQYRYHARWRAVRDETKYDRLIAFGQALEGIRRQTAHDMALPGLPREKVLGTIVRLLETTLIRIGNEEYARQNGSFGLTTMHNRHVAVAGSDLRFEFKGKSGIKHVIDLHNKRLARIVRSCRDLPGHELFQYVDEEGTRHAIDSADVNAYLQQITGSNFTAKDFRTWAGTVLAAQALQEFEEFDSDTQAKRNIMTAIEAVAKRLGNTNAICRKCYVHPAVLDAYLDGTLRQTLGNKVEQELKHSLAHLHPEEAVVLAFLQERLKRDS